MNIFENTNSKKVSRKSFIIYSGLVLMGLYSLIKIPFGFLKGKEKAKIENLKSDDVRFSANPESVKRT